MIERVKVPTHGGGEIDVELDQRPVNRRAKFVLPSIPVNWEGRRIQMQSTIDLVGTDDGPAYENVVHRHPAGRDRRCCVYRGANLEDAIMAGHSLCFAWGHFFLDGNPASDAEATTP